MDEVIAFTKVKLPFGWLGNMSPHPIIFWDKEWRTAEALFQAGRFVTDDPIREEIRAEASPMSAKMIELAGAVEGYAKQDGKETAEFLRWADRIGFETFGDQPGERQFRVALFFKTD